jgi:hypothetical protein
VSTKNASSIRGAMLLDFVRSSADEQVSVILEVSRARLPSTAIDVNPQFAKHRKRVREIAPRARASDVEAVKDELRQLGLARVARFNQLSGSFVVEVTPRQLLKLSKVPSIQAIRANRSYLRYRSLPDA